MVRSFQVFWKTRAILLFHPPDWVGPIGWQELQNFVNGVTFVKVDAEMIVLKQGCPQERAKGDGWE
jgi:hypothetical protein